MQTTSYGLDELLRRAKNHSLTIPQFQRNFVWKQTQTRLLVDSMSRSFPIGSLLLLASNPELPLSARPIMAAIRDEDSTGDNVSDSAAKDDEYHILDGQQRITSIAHVFLDAHPTQRYYVDLRKILEKHHDRVESSWIIARQRGVINPARKDRDRLLRADIILNQFEAHSAVTEYIEDSKDFCDHDKQWRREAAARINGVFETIRNYKVPVVVLERDSGVESICRVFETINSTGTRLTTFDLAVARFYHPGLDLRKLWDVAKEAHPILKDYKVDGERVLQVLSLMTAFKRGVDRPEPTRTYQLNLKSDEIKEGWQGAAQSLAEAYGWAQAQGARAPLKTLPSQNLLVVLAAVRQLRRVETGKDSWDNHDSIRRWYFSKVMQAGASQASNYRIGQDFRALRRHALEGKPLEPVEVTLNAESILELKPSDVRYKSLQNVFAMTIRQDLVTGNIIDSESVLHDHHIFPSSASRKRDLPKNMVDGICNRIPVLGESNQSLGEGYPQEYFRKMAERARQAGTLDQLKTRMADCLIPGDPCDPAWADIFAIDRFEEFCRKRADLILGRVREIVGDSLRDPSSDNEMAEDIDD